MAQYLKANKINFKNALKLYTKCERDQTNITFRYIFIFSFL